MASGSTLYVLQHIYTTDLPLDHSSGAPHMRSGVVDTLRMSPTFVFLAAKPMCMCTKTIVRSLIQKLLKPPLLGTSLVPRVTGYGISIPDPSYCPEMSPALGNGSGNTRWTGVSYGTGLMSCCL